MEMQYLPAEFYARLEPPSSLGVFQSARPPKVENYFVTGLIQFNISSGHFRFVDLYTRKRTVCVYDAGVKTELDAKEKDRVRDEPGWLNYIARYRRWYDSPQPEYGTGKTNRLPVGWYMGKLFGGAKKMQVVLWNVCSLNKWMREKVTFLRATAAEIVILQ